MEVPDIIKYYDIPNGFVGYSGNNVSMSKDYFSKQNEISYISFVLGYDYLNDKLKKSESPECDLSYDICSSIAEQFMKSEEYKNLNHSTYEMLEKWVNNNQDLINGYLNTNEKTRMLDNGIYVIDLGYRNKQPIALVQRGKGEYTEYVVAFNYRIKDNKMDWAYAYYYDKDIDKAKQDFEKVLQGGNLSKTFERKEDR